MLITKPTTLHFRTSKKGKLYVYANKRLYSIKPFEANKTFIFNLPFNGWYSFSGDGFTLTNTTDLIKSGKIINLPKPERNLNNFGIDKITVDTLSNSPARIYTKDNIIVLNPKFFAYPIEVKIFILLHELGHFYYKTESKADLYAMYHFNEFGCNHSQAYNSLAGILNECNADGTPNFKNIDRIEQAYNTLKK